MNSNLKKLYYKYVYTTFIDHYRQLFLTEEYKKIGIEYNIKYPIASNFANMNEEMFFNNPQSKIDFYEASKKQEKIKNTFFSNIEEICSSCPNNEYYICSDIFKNNFIDKKYHYGESTDYIISKLEEEIKKHNL